MTLDDMYVGQYTCNPDAVYHQIAIDYDRYSGVYSGARFTAWPGLRPDDIDAGDITCEAFWAKHRSCLHGRGTTPQGAFLDLVAKIGDKWDVSGSLRVVWVNADTPLLYGSTVFSEWLA